MKKATIFVLIIMIILGMFVISSKVYAANDTILNDESTGKLIEIKESAAKSLEDYKEKYGSDAYGFTAYILNQIRIYSIPLCFLGIAISAIYQYVIGIRKLDTKEKGLVMMVTFITLLIICQILPLAFAIIVKFGRG